MSKSMWFLVLLMSVSGCLSHVRTLFYSTVIPPAGIIVGSSNDAGYTTYLGVPYGLVNTSNPFGPAVKYPHFEEPFKADNDNVSCPQQSFSGVPTGTIQCLTLNIYVPERSTKKTFPVMVWIHGGAFTGGSAQASASDPISLLNNDVIVVAINYRLGIYGFMCLDTPEVPGNQGLKDQTLALRWIQENIAAFGGDVNKITLFGESAGGMSVNLHLFSLYEKLFNQVIIESGSALSYWMMVESNNTIPLTLAYKLGFKTSDINEALSFLSTIDAHLLVKTAADLKITGSGNDQPLTKPCVEKTFDGVENFITDHPMNVKSTKASKTPIIIGHNIREFAFEYANQNETFFETFDLKMLFAMGFDMDNDLEDALNAVRHFYFGDEKISKNVSEQLVELGTDLIFGHSTQRMAEKLLDSGAENVYRYVFSYLGASHGDELAYLFDTTMSSPFANVTEDEQLMIDNALVKSRLTTLWTNFVKNGNPTPEPSELLPFTWAPVTNSTQSYLDMDLDFTPSSRPDHERMAFWDLFYKLYGKYQKWYPVEPTLVCNNGPKLERNDFITIAILLLYYLFINIHYLS